MFCLCALQFLGIDVLLIWENSWNHIMLSICLRSNIKNSFYLLTWDETLGAFLCSALYNPANVCEGHCYKSINKPPNSKSNCWQSWAAETHLWFPPALTEFGRHCVGDNSLSRTRVCRSSADPPLSFWSENWLRWKMSALSDPFPSHEAMTALEKRQIGWRCRGASCLWQGWQESPAVPHGTFQSLSIKATPWQDRGFPPVPPALQESGMWKPERCHYRWKNTVSPVELYSFIALTNAVSLGHLIFAL